MKRSLSALAGRWAAVTVAFVVVWACTDNSGPGRVPTVRITSPASDVRFHVGDVVAFQATATDVSDGSLSGASIAWFLDSIPAAFGSGDSTQLRIQSVGHHVVVARARNTSGGTAVDRVSLNVL